MEVIKAFLLVALGIGLDALHNKIRRDSERIAYSRGYRQAQKEESLHRATHGESATVRLDKEPDHPDRYKVDANIPESFMTDLKTKGRAVWIRKGG